MAEKSSTLRRLLSRSNSIKSGTRPIQAVVRPDTIPNGDNDLVITGSDVTVSHEFLEGCELLRVTRKKARTRTFSIAPQSGAVLIDGNTKFSVDMIRDIRVADDASHYRELCKISSEHEERWLSVIYYLDNSKLKVLHVICPTTEILEHFRGSLTRLYQRRSRFLGASQSLFGSGASPMDEDLWCSFMPSQSVQYSGCQKSSCNSSGTEIEKTSMTFDEVEVLCQKLYFDAPSALLLGLFKQVDKEATGHLDFSAFKKFVDLLKVRQDLLKVYDMHKAPGHAEMTKSEFLSFLTDIQHMCGTPETLQKIFERAREPTSSGKKESISPTNFAAYITSRQNAILSPVTCDYTRPINEYFISSSHNTYLTGRQVGDESSIEPYIRALQRGCRCIEIDIWSNSDNYPEVRHGRAFTSSVSLEAVLKVIDKYAFFVSPWPLIISLEIRCGPKPQEIVADMLLRVFGSVLVTVKEESRTDQLPAPEDLRHRILLKVKSEGEIDSALLQVVHHTSSQHTSLKDSEGQLSPDKQGPPMFEDSSLSASNADSDVDRQPTTSRSSSVSSRSSSISSSGPTTYRPFVRATTINDELVLLAPYCRAIKFRNFSLPEAKTFNHTFSLSERKIKQFSRDLLVQVKKHNTRFLMRVYPSQSRIMSSNFLPHHFWQQGIQMVAMNWQTQDLGMRINEAFFSLGEDSSADVSGYILKPKAMRTWFKGQEPSNRHWTRTKWEIEVVSGVQLPRTPSGTGKLSPVVEMEVIRSTPAFKLDTVSSTSSSLEKDRETKWRSSVVEDNGFNPLFHAEFSFIMPEDEDPYFTFLRFVVKDHPSNETLAQCVLPMYRLQRGYRSAGLCDMNGEKFVFSALLLKISSTACPGAPAVS